MSKQVASLEIGFDAATTKHYATIENATKAANKVADQCTGMVCVRIMPVIVGDAIRFSPMFYAFREVQDMPHVARAGFYCFK